MAIFEDNFESYSVGNLAGQGDWNGASKNKEDYQVQSGTTYSGSRAVYVKASGGGGFNYSHILKVGTETSTGSVIFYYYPIAGTSNDIMLRSSTPTTIVQFHVTADNLQYLNSSGAPVSLVEGWTRQWYKVEIDWRSSDNTVKYKITPGMADWSSWVAQRNAGNPDRILLECESFVDDPIASFYLDDISGDSTPTPPTTTAQNGLLFSTNF